MRRRFLTSLNMVVLALAMLTACAQQPAPVAETQAPVPVDGIGYLVFRAPIVSQSRDLFMAGIDRLVAAGAREVRIGITSPGGDIAAAQTMVDYMHRLHANEAVTFKVYNLGVVAAAASYVFLNAQERYAKNGSVFLFHPAKLVSNGPITAPVLREQADKLDAYERVVRSALKARTRLTDSEALTYVRRTVMLNPDDAQRDGIIDGIADYTYPKGARMWTVAAPPRQPPPKPGVPTPN